VATRTLGPIVVAAVLIGGCLFPSLDGLSGGVDASIDGAADGHADAEAGACPPNADPALVAYYPFDEGMGTIAHDCSGNGYTAYLTGSDAGGPTWTAGHDGGALHFDPNLQSCVILGSANANQVGGAITVTAWINYVDPIDSSGSNYVIGQRTTTGYAWRLAVESGFNDAGGDGIGFVVGAGGGNDDDVLAFIQPTGWHHVAGVFDPTGPAQTVYLDGVPTLASPSATMIIADPNSTTIRIGCRGDDSNYFGGLIDEVRVYSRALSTAEIAALAAP
jgi:hypothetical protein